MVFKSLAGHGGVIQELITHHLAQKLVLGQLLGEVVVVSQFFDFAHAVDQDDFLETLISFRVAYHAQKWRHACSGGKQIQIFAWQEIVNQQSARGLAANNDLVAYLDMLQTRSQRAVLHLDAQKLQMLFVISADDAVSAQQRFFVHAQPDHREMAVRKTQSLVAGGGETKQAVGPMVDGQNFFFLESAHGGGSNG